METEMRSMRWIALAAAAVLAACGGDDKDATGPGNGGGATTFSADVSGDLQASLKGAALFGQATDPEYGDVFGLEMSETGAGEGFIQVVRLGGEVPSPGTYAIADALNGTPADGDFVAMAFDSDNGEPTAIFVATGGTLKVTSASGSAFKGTFTFNAQGGLFSDPETTLSIKVSGSFHATPATQGLTINSRSIRRSR
jgi:hypothetical protein